MTGFARAASAALLATQTDLVEDDRRRHRRVERRRHPMHWDSDDRVAQLPVSMAQPVSLVADDQHGLATPVEVTERRRRPRARPDHLKRRQLAPHVAYPGRDVVMRAERDARDREERADARADRRRI